MPSQVTDWLADRSLGLQHTTSVVRMFTEDTKSPACGALSHEASSHPNICNMRALDAPPSQCLRSTEKTKKSPFAVQMQHANLSCFQRSGGTVRLLLHITGRCHSVGHLQQTNLRSLIRTECSFRNTSQEPKELSLVRRTYRRKQPAYRSRRSKGVGFERNTMVPSPAGTPFACTRTGSRGGTIGMLPEQFCRFAQFHYCTSRNLFGRANRASCFLIPEGKVFALAYCSGLHCIALNCIALHWWRLRCSHCEKSRSITCRA